MRKVWLTTFLLMAGAMASAQQVPQKDKTATILLDHISLAEALTVLGISYGVDFSYSDDVVPADVFVNLSVRDENLAGALDKLLLPFAITYKRINNRVILKRSTRVLMQTVRGIVLDALTNAPVPGASIVIREPQPPMGAITDEDGKFRITGVPLGRITLVVSSLGYDRRSYENILLGSGKELVLEVKLSESVATMDEVVISALRNDGIPGSGMAVTSSHSFSVEETKRYAGSLGDPARMASAFAGVTGASDENNALIVRGNSPRGVLWRMEGIEIPNPNHFATEGASSGIVSVLSPNVIEHSEFLTGAFPAQYGNVLSAVFDVSLRNGNNENKEYTFQAGLLGLEASAEGPFSRKHPSSYLVNYRYSSLSVLDKLGVDLNEAGQYKDYQDAAFKLHLPTARSGTFSLFGIGGLSRSNKTDTINFDNNISDMAAVGIGYEHRLREHTFFHSALSFSGTRIGRYNKISGLEAGPLSLEENYSKSYTRALVSAKRRITGRYFIEGGLISSYLNYNFFLRNLDPSNMAYQEIINFRERGHTVITQGFLYAKQYFSPALSGSYGMHFIHFSLTGDHSFEPRMGVRWKLSENDALNAAWGRHSRVENLQYYLARDHQPGASEVQINRDLGFTKATHLVASYERLLAATHKAKLETYYQKLYNAPVQTDPRSLYTSINEDTGFITDTLINKGRGRNYGVELSLERPFSRDFYYLANVSLYQSKFSVSNLPERNTAYNGNYTVHMLAGKEFAVAGQRDRLGLNVKITTAGGRRYVPIDLERSIAEGRQVHDQENAFGRRMPPYGRADLQLVYKLNRPGYSLEWRLDVQNITNHRNPSYYYYNNENKSVMLRRQVGTIPLLSCRVEF
jgi:hypothetical protein